MTTQTKYDVTLAPIPGHADIVVRDRVNLHIDPRYGVDVSNASGAISGGTYTTSRIATGGPSGGPASFARRVIGGTPTGAGTVNDGNFGLTPVTPGQVLRCGHYFRPSLLIPTAVLQLAFYTSGGAAVGGTVQVGAASALAANVWSWIAATSTLVVPATAAKVKMQVTLGGVVPVAGDTYDDTGRIIHEAIASDQATLAFFDGEFPGATWDGTRYKSTSRSKRIS